jgi:glycosyltransferase involved in cell wall biosynthesis
VPVYRNVETLVELHSSVRRVLETRSLTYEVLFAGDACPDNSVSILKALAKLDPSVAIES